MEIFVQTLTEQLIDSKLKNRVISEKQLDRIITGSRQRRYHLVNRAMKAGELLRLRRGSYVLDARFRDYPAHPFALAQAYVPGSHVSFETALAHHGWIPEAVRVTTSVTPGQKSISYSHSVFGEFTFHPLAIQNGRFLELVDREQQLHQTMLVARPMRALMDLVCLRKVEWKGMDWLTQGLRIDYELLREVTSAEIRILETVYKQKRVKEFLKSLARETGND